MMSTVDYILPDEIEERIWNYADLVGMGFFRR